MFHQFHPISHSCGNMNIVDSHTGNLKQKSGLFLSPVLTLWGGGHFDGHRVMYGGEQGLVPEGPICIFWQR